MNIYNESVSVKKIQQCDKTSKLKEAVKRPGRSQKKEGGRNFKGAFLTKGVLLQENV